MKESYINLKECIDDSIKIASIEAVEGVEKDIGGPFGAAIIQKRENKYYIIAVARNSVLKEKDATCHAEINAIRQASRILDRYDLNDCILVTTAKCCPMCISAACWSKIKKVYYCLDYIYASEHGFKDANILEYLNGKNNIISEINIENDYARLPFQKWREKENKDQY